MQTNFLAMLFERGGSVMLILAVLSLGTLTLILQKWIQFIRLNLYRDEMMEEVKTYIADGRMEELKNYVKREQSPLARILETAIAVKENQSLTQEQRLQAVEAAAASLFRTLESNLRAIELAANMSPLLGLLGTVLGMVKAFARIESAGARVDPSMLAGGIWEALITTIAGLSIAIPALIAFTLLDAALEKYRGKVKELIYCILSSTHIA